jgi:acyl-CoA thioester hydrolase
MSRTRRSDWFTHRLRVRYAETDQMGVVYHANYLNWFEQARTEWTRHHGITYRSLEHQGLYLPVVNLTIQYRNAARYDDEIEVNVCVVELTPLRISFEYEVLGRDPVGNPSLLVTGNSEHVWVDRDWKPIRLSKVAPASYQQFIHATQEVD